jgi:hypothetical protein
MSSLAPGVIVNVVPVVPPLVDVSSRAHRIEPVLLKTPVDSVKAESSPYAPYTMHAGEVAAAEIAVA